MTARLLLDTHAFYWALSSPNRIPPATLELLSDRSTEVFVSSIVAFEIATKVRIGKFPPAAMILEGFSHRLSELHASELQLSAEHAILAGRLDWDHRDPFDRLLAAQSIVENLPLASGDAEFRRAPGVRVHWE